jgi:hypothetical protein
MIPKANTSDFAEKTGASPKHSGACVRRKRYHILNSAHFVSFD